jgi:hypothetical protein
VTGVSTASKRRPARPKPSDIESIIGEIETPETSVTLCLKGSLVAEFERLSTQLDGMTTDPINLAGDGPGRDIAARLTLLREEMLAHERVFLFRAVTPRGAWRKAAGKRPVKLPEIGDDEYADLYHGWVCEIVAVSAIDPVMSPEQVQRLADKLSDGQWQKLANAAWKVNDDAQGIPFSVAASVLSRSSGGRSKQPEPSENPAHGSLAGSPSPDTSTTTPDD